MLLIPGEKGELLEVEPLLAANHEAARAQRLRDIAERKAKGGMLDDGIDWVKLNPAKVSAAIAARDSAALRDAASELVAATAALLVPLDARAPDPRLEGVRAQCVVLSERRLRILQRNEMLAQVAREGAQGLEALGLAVDRIYEARRAYVAEAVARVELTDRAFDAVDGQLAAHALDVLERNRLILPLYDVASAFQELPPGKGSRSGSSAESTSSASSAPLARRIDESSSAVTEEGPSPTKERPGRPTPVLAVT